MDRRSIIGLMSVFAAASMATFSDGAPSGFWDEREKISPEEREIRAKRHKMQLAKSNGLKEFFYDGGSVWALNKKNADKKAAKKGWK